MVGLSWKSKRTTISCMQKRSAVIPVFFLFLVLAILFFVFPSKGLTGILEQATLPLRNVIFTTFHKGEKVQTTEEKLQEENNQLLTQLAKQKELEKDNQALRAQFETSDPAPRTLLPAHVVGSSTNQIIIDKGMSDGVEKGSIVVVKDNLVGVVVKSLPHLAVVELVTHENTSFTARTSKTSALGIINGNGGDRLILDKVVLSDKLEKGDAIVTKGDLDEKGTGYPSGLVVGKIMSVNKKASDVFQRAEVKSLVDFEKTETVFVIKN